MEAVLFSVLEASLRGSIVILAVIALRMVLKKAPKNLFCLLWLLAGLRLMLPFEIESSLSLQPDYTPAPQAILQSTIREEILNDQDQTLADIPGTSDFPIQIPVAPEETPEHMESVSYLYYTEDGVATGPVMFSDIAGPIWLLGLGVMLTLSCFSYWKLKRRVAEACRTADGCWECPGLETAFVLGIVNPRIYLPTGLTDPERKFIFDHENTHIARHDHISKLLGYLVLSVHWFNPLVWLGYHLLCRDIELACDERVVKFMDLQQRKAYSGALLTCSSHTSRFSACPVAFGESSPKQRILNVLHYKKPTLWIMVLALIAVIFVAVCLLTSPRETSTEETVPEASTAPTEAPTTASSVTELPQLPPEDTDSLIQKCRDAMEALKASEEQYLHIESASDPNDVRNTYLRTPRGWLFRYQRPGWDYQEVSVLHYDSRQYVFCGDQNEDGVMTAPYYWHTEHDSDGTLFQLPYPFDLDWSSIELSFSGYSTEYEWETITLTFPEYLDVFVFTFDPDGNLGMFDVGDSSGEPEASTLRCYVYSPWDDPDAYLEQMHREASALADRKPQALTQAEYQALFTRETDGHYTTDWIEELFSVFYQDPEEFVAQLSVLNQADPDRVGTVLMHMSRDLTFHAVYLFEYTVRTIPVDHYPHILEQLKMMCPGYVKEQMEQVETDLAIYANAQLAKCNTALQNYKAAGYWCLVENNFYSGDVLNTSSDCTWYIRGKDFLCHTRIPEDGGCSDFLTLCQDGCHYNRQGFTSIGKEFGDSWESEWNTGLYNNNALRMPWPLRFDWANADLTYLESTRDDFYEEIRISTLGDPTGQNGAVQKYIVTFRLNKDGSLQHIRLNYLYGDTIVETVIVPREITRQEVDQLLLQHHTEALSHTQHHEEDHHDDHHG